MQDRLARALMGAVRAGKKDDLIAPVSKQDVAAYNAAIRAGENGPDVPYVDKSAWVKRISVHTAKGV